jgi:hypothetical protein
LFGESEKKMDRLWKRFGERGSECESGERRKRKRVWRRRRR